MTMLTLTITGMTCSHCVRAVTAALGKVPGVTNVREVSLERGEALVDGAPDPATLARALHDEGFEARVRE
jgi:copper chaperone